jgi:hypothetical protein
LFMDIPKHIGLNGIETLFFRHFHYVRPHPWCWSRIMYCTRNKHRSNTIDCDCSIIITDFVWSTSDILKSYWIGNNIR